MPNLRYIVGQPGGPAGPFWSVVRSDGRVIAMQIPDEETARGIADALTAHPAAQPRWPQGEQAATSLGDTWALIEMADSAIEIDYRRIAAATLARLNGGAG